MRCLILLRHGRTSWNADLRAQGHADIGLDETGHAQARAVAPGIAALSPDLLWSSDLRRARETAEPIAAATGLDVVLDARLREVDVGARSGLTLGEFAEQYPAEHNALITGADGPLVEGEETRAAMVERVTAALRDLLAALGPDGTGVAVLHGWCGKAALVDLLGLPSGSHAVLRGMDNCHAAVLVEDRGLRLRAYNVDFVPTSPVG